MCAYICESYEPMGKRTKESPKTLSSWRLHRWKEVQFFESFAHKLVPLLHAMKIRDAKVAVDNGCVGEIEEIAGMAREESQAQKEVT